MHNLYTPKYFKDSIPDWKRKKDPFLSRLFYRPLSFLIASFCVNNRINANTVSYFSAGVAIIACASYIIPYYGFHVLGAILINIWLILDCTDGNLARSYKKQPFGEFADGISSYILVGLMCTTISFSVYYTDDV